MTGCGAATNVRYNFCLLPSAICLSLILAFAAGCSGGSERKAETGGGRVYASVNEARLTGAGLRALVPGDFYNTLTPEHKKEIIQEWVNNELLYQEALRRKIDRDPETIRIIENTKRNLISNELLERNLSEVKTPDEKTLQAFYESRKKYFTLPDHEYRVRYAAFETKQQAEDFWTKVKTRSRFSELAMEMSKDPSARDGGDLGAVSEETVEPALWNAINDTVKKFGLVKISDPFRTSTGWACTIVDEMYEAGSAKPFKAVQEQVLDMYMVEKRDEARGELLKKLSAGAKIVLSFEEKK